MKLSLVAIFSFFVFSAGAQNSTVFNSIYDFKVAALKGGVIDLSQFKGKKMLIVNTPEERDFANQYAELEELSKKYQGNLVVIGVVTDDFQIEPGSKKNPSREKNYNVTFPLAAKMYVKGSEIAPLYKWLSDKKYNNFQDTEVGWDFEKFLINENGKLVAVFDPRVRAQNRELVAAIEK